MATDDPNKIGELEEKIWLAEEDLQKHEPQVVRWAKNRLRRQERINAP